MTAPARRGGDAADWWAARPAPAPLAEDDEPVEADPDQVSDDADEERLR